MEKTPMQELIEYLENNSLIDKKGLISICKKLLEKEKQVIEDAFNSIYASSKLMNGEDYYKQKFKQ
jgi:hypothetical protein